EDVAFAELLVEEQRGLVAETGRDARSARRHVNRLVELDAFPSVVLQDGRMRGIEPCHGLKALALAAGVARLLDGVSGDRHASAAYREVSERDPHAAAGADVLAQRILEGGRHSAEIAQDDEGVFGRGD